MFMFNIRGSGVRFLFVVTFVFILIKLVGGGVEGITYHRVLGTPCQVSPPETMKI